MTSLLSELTNPCSTTNLTQQWRREYRERINEEESRERRESAKRRSQMSSAERARIYTPTFYAVKDELDARRAQLEQAQAAAAAAKRINLFTLLRSCFGR